MLGTLVIQGLTLGLLIKRLPIGPDGSYGEEMLLARRQLNEAAVAYLQRSTGDAAVRLRAELGELRAATASEDEAAGTKSLRLACVTRQRAALNAMRRAGSIGDDVFQALQQDLDWTQLANSCHDAVRLEEG